MSPRVKNIFKKFGGWTAFVTISYLLASAPNLYWLGSSGKWNGRQAVCAAAITEGKDADLEQIVQNPIQWNSQSVLVTGELTYSPDQETFYLRDGMFTIPLDVSDCQDLDAFKNSETLVAVNGTVKTDNGGQFIDVNGILETAPGFVQNIFDAGILLIFGTIAFVIWLIPRLLRRLLTLIHILKPKPVAPKKKGKDNKNPLYAVIMGICAPILWLFNPVIGMGAYIFGFSIAWQGLKTPKRKTAIAGAVLCGGGFVMMTLISVGLGNFTTPSLPNLFATNQSSILAELKPTGQEPLEIAPYTSAEFDLSIHQPKGWIPNENNPSYDAPLVFVGPADGSVGGKPYQPEIKAGTIPMASLDANNLADAVAVFVKSVLRQFKNFSLVEEENHALADGSLDAEYLDATYTNASGTAVHLLSLFTIGGGNVYIVGSEIPADKWSSYEPIIRESLRTFELRSIR